MVKFLFPWLQQEEGKTPRMFFNLIKDEYHLELIIYCICLYVVEGMCCNGSKMPEIVFLYLVTPPIILNTVWFPF